MTESQPDIKHIRKTHKKKKHKLKTEKIETRNITKDIRDDILLLGYTELPSHEIQHSHSFPHSLAYPEPGWPMYLSDSDRD